MRLVFLDTETTGLDPRRHAVWEIAYAVDDGPIRSGIVPHVLRSPDPDALRMNGYLDRLGPRDYNLDADLREAVTGQTIVAANPAFDTSFLLARWGTAPWHHRLWDVEAYAAGVLGWTSIRGMADIATALRGLGFDIPYPDHSAAADVDALRASFYALQNIRKGLV